jgi:hypothetical protein
MTYFGSLNYYKNIKNKLEQKNKMADKMAAKHEFSIAQSIFMQIN